MCQRHWDELKHALEERGLAPFISPDAKEAARRAAISLSDQPRGRDSFDPLMVAHNAIVANALKVVGPLVMAQNDDGSERCPLCLLIDGCGCEHRGTPECDFGRWITYAADDALAAAKESADA